MNFLVKWGIVFSMLSIITIYTFAGLNLMGTLRSEMIPSAQASEMQMSIVPAVFYDVDTNESIDNKTMQHILRWAYFTVTDMNETDKDGNEIYGVNVTWERKIFPKHVCDIEKFLKKQPELSRTYPESKKFMGYCSKGGRGKFIPLIPDVPTIS